MNIFFIILAFVVIIGFIIMFKVLKSFAKLFFYFTIISIFVIGILSYFVLKDVTEFKNGMANGDNLYLLSEGNEITAGFSLSGLDLGTMKEVEIPEYNQYEDLEYFRIFTFKEEAFADTDLIIDDEIINLNNKNYEFALQLAQELQEDTTFIIKEFRKDNLEIYPETLTFKLLKLI
jgi:hypothetical protein